MLRAKSIVANSFVFIMLITAACQAGIKMPAFFSDHMVLQAEMENPIWGVGQPNSDIEVKIGSVSAQTTAGADGKWMVRLPALPVGGPYEMTISGDGTVVIKDVLVGEVWLCSGQSNMDMEVKDAKDFEKESAAADYPQIRMFEVLRSTADQPQSDTLWRRNWVVCSPQTVGGFSATAYFFGRMLHQELKVPVGLLVCSYGGSPIEAWMSKPTLQSKFPQILKKQQEMVAAWDPKAVQERYEAELKRYEEAKASGNTAAAAEPPDKPLDPTTSPRRPTGQYNAMIAPLVPLAFRGVIWYQGESNAKGADQYASLFAAMVAEWREAFGRQFPFCFVQLASYGKLSDKPTDTTWARLREAQLKSLEVPQTAMAVAVDIDDAATIHPRKKQEVGRRLALASLALAYGKSLVSSGPIFECFKIEGNKCRVTFKNASGIKSSDGGPLKGFAIAGADKKFYWADAKIDGASIVISSSKVTEPLAVRYAWGNAPSCNLVNEAGLPASPFRTDDWPPCNLLGEGE